MSGYSTLLLGTGATALSVARWLSARGQPWMICEPCDEGGEAALHALAAKLEAQDLQPSAFGMGEAEGGRMLARSRQVVCSPGIAPCHPLVRRALALGQEVLTDLDLFARYLAPDGRPQVPVVAVTGTNGKSTVVSLLAAMAEEAGLNVAVGGNLGPPALDLIDPARQLYVLEVSSFQLEYCAYLPCTLGAMLNLAADHMDRHGHLRRYGEIKRRIFAGAEKLLYNRNDPLTTPPPWETGERYSFGSDAPAQAGDYGLRNHVLCRGQIELARRADIAPQGACTTRNALAALALGDLLALDVDAMRRALANFSALPHRSQTVREQGGVRWIDNSKATNAAASIAALRALGKPATGPNVLFIAGGDSKGAEMHQLGLEAAGRVRLALLIGAAADSMEKILKGHCAVRRCADLAEAVDAAGKEAKSGDQVLLAPACSSLDQFDNYAQRGEQFAGYARGAGA